MVLVGKYGNRDVQKLQGAVRNLLAGRGQIGRLLFSRSRRRISRSRSLLRWAFSLGVSRLPGADFIARQAVVGPDCNSRTIFIRSS